MSCHMLDGLSSLCKAFWILHAALLLWISDHHYLVEVINYVCRISVELRGFCGCVGLQGK